MAQVNGPPHPAPPHSSDPVSSHTQIKQTPQSKLLKEEPRKPVLTEIAPLPSTTTTLLDTDIQMHGRASPPSATLTSRIDPSAVSGASVPPSQTAPVAAAKLAEPRRGSSTLPDGQTSQKPAAPAGPIKQRQAKQKDKDPDITHKPKNGGLDPPAKMSTTEPAIEPMEAVQHQSPVLPSKNTKDVTETPSENDRNAEQTDATKQAVAAPARRPARRIRKPAQKRDASQGLSPVPNQARKAQKTSGRVAEKDDGPVVDEPKCVLGSLEHYREKCIELERARQEKLFQAEKKKLYSEQIVRWTYDHEVRLAEEEYDSARRILTVRLLQENAEKQRRVEELRYKIVRDDVNGVWHKRHEMSLRGRQASGTNDDSGAGEREDVGETNTECHPRSGRPARRRPAAPPAEVSGRAVRVELDTNEVQADLDEMNGDRRAGSKHGRRAGR